MKLTKHPLMLDPRAPAFMPADEAVIRKLQGSFEMLSERGDQFTRLFYDKLFTAHPGLRGLFKSDPAAQRAKLLESLKMVIMHLRNPAAQAAHLGALGQRHAGYGAKPEHYPIVCRLMVEAMAQTAGAAWSPDLTTEWSQAMSLVCDAMQRPSQPPPGPGAEPTATSGPTHG